jgi:hypothetical protein
MERQTGPGTTDRAAARAIDVAPGAEVSGIDFRLIVNRVIELTPD